MVGLPGSNGNALTSAWFDKLKDCCEELPDLQEWLSQEVDVLKSFYFGEKNTEDAAYAITRPISTNPVPKVEYSYTPQLVALDSLWSIILSTLLACPENRVEDMFNLLDAISKIPDKMHKGEAKNPANNELLTWKGIPYFGAALHEFYYPEPGVAHDKYKDDPKELESERRTYLEMQDLTARIIAHGIFLPSYTDIVYIIRCLEQKDDAKDVGEPFFGIKFDFEIPAMAYRFRSYGKEIYRMVVKSDTVETGWTSQEEPEGVKKFDNGQQRWDFWKKRFTEMAENYDDENVRKAAKEILGYMADAEANDRKEPEKSVDVL
ncbi:hypothetical protein K470DRAFT_260834 [Piedraia hortae CBS 480.64]|uniref:Uncharacterized protein n=1 Tax=Piedraia hortae CBS 480.64 TaxID=1314780 RepID=A0A6A7BRV7_9PEZI|nr:hypothetical protein K470DRAFT_260834 [Piedraia hortae CBS 480.64]